MRRREQAADPVHGVVDEVVQLARDLVDAVHVGRVQGMSLVHGQALGLAVHLPGPRVHHARLGVVLAQGLQDPELAAAVDLQVGEGVGHGVDVADLPGQVEEHVLAPHQVAHPVPAHVGDVDLHPVLVAREVEEVAAVVGQQAVHGQHPGPQVGQAPAEVAPDEAEAARDQDLPSPVEVPVVAAHARSRRWPRRGPRPGAACAPPAPPTAARGRASVRATRGRLKNWLLP